MSHKDIRQSYEEWLKLLEETGNKDLLDDHFNVWLEAWHVASVLAHEKKAQH